MSGLSARQRFVKTPSEVRNIRLGLADLLDTGELLTGTPTITASPSSLTIGSPAVNGSTLTIDDTTYQAGQAITFTISGGVAGVLYEISVVVSTNASQTLERYVYISVETSASSTGEPTVGGDYDTLRRHIGDYLGKSRDPDDWSQNDYERIEDCIDAGYRQMLQPPPLPGERVSHQWSFLRPIASLTLWGDVTAIASGVPTYDSTSGLSTLTATTGAFLATMVGKRLTFADSSDEYTVAAYVSPTVLKLTGDASGETSGDTFTVAADGDYQLSDDFGGLDGELYFTADSNTWYPVRVVGEGQILAQRSIEHSVSIRGLTPRDAALVPINSTSTTQGQRFQLMVWPEISPGERHIAQFRYHALQNRLSLSRPFALGGAAHFQTLLQSCLAVAEAYQNDVRGLHHQMFIERLTASVNHDRVAFGPKRIGMLRDPGMLPQVRPERGSIVTYSANGITYP